MFSGSKKYMEEWFILIVKTLASLNELDVLGHIWSA